ncbi:hypothetical protein JVX93_16080 [Mycolicibacterium boenickei]|nr:hypothetical protein JVX93_16080 [Mycolicibacterium boenickei]
MTDSRLGRSPRSPQELVRELDRRMKALERSQTARIGPWVLSALAGRLVATRPGEILHVGQEPEPVVVDLSQRGSQVTEEEIAGAVTGGNGDTFSSITDWLTAKWSELTTTTTNANTSMGNFTSLFSGFSVPDIGSLITDLLGTKSTAGTAGSNATTALGKILSMLTGSGEANESALGTAIANAKANAATAIGNFSSILSSFGLGSVGAWITDLLGTKSTASTAGTNATTALGNWTSALGNSGDANAGALGASLANAKGNASAAISNFASIFSGFSVPNLGTWITDLLGTKSTASTAGTNATTALGTANNASTKAQGWIDGFWNGYRGDTASGVAVADAQDQAAAIAETQAALASALAALQSDQDGSTFNGVSGTDTFDRVTASGAGGPGFWSESWTGNPTTGIYCDGADLRMKDSTSGVGGAAVEMRCINPAFEHTLTSYQKITWTCGAISGDNPAGASSIMQHTRIKFRENDAETQYGFLEFGGNGQAQWGYRNGGSVTMVGSAFALAEPTAGVKIVIVVGTNTVSGLRKYQVFRNNVFINEWDDSTTALVAEGTNNLGWGAQLFWGTWLFATTNTQHSPPSIGSMSISDNVPPTYKGTTARIFRASSTGVSFPAATAGQFVPANFFDTVDYCTSDITITFGRRMTVTKEGSYIVVGRILMGNWGANNKGYLGLYKNGVMARRGDGFGAANIGNNVASWEMATWSIYLVPGDYVDLAYVHDATQSNCRGEASGTESYFEITRIG